MRLGALCRKSFTCNRPHSARPSSAIGCASHAKTSDADTLANCSAVSTEAATPFFVHPDLRPPRRDHMCREMPARGVGFNCFVGDQKPMLGMHKLLKRMFRHPKGVLGRLGVVIMARVNRDAAAQ